MSFSQCDALATPLTSMTKETNRNEYAVPCVLSGFPFGVYHIYFSLTMLPYYLIFLLEAFFAYVV
jgi:hypothetical protein